MWIEVISDNQWYNLSLAEMSLLLKINFVKERGKEKWHSNRIVGRNRKKRLLAKCKETTTL